MKTKLANAARIVAPKMIGATQILASPEYVGTVARVKRINRHFYAAVVSEAANAFTDQSSWGVGLTVWLEDGRWVVGQGSYAGYAEVGRYVSLTVALGVAVWSASERGHAEGRW